MDCYTCASLSGKKPLFPESKIYEGAFWIVEHIYPVKIVGWLVIVLKRHTEALHELTAEELRELADIQYKLSRSLHRTLQATKEYIACFAEAEGFNHVHVHMIGKTNVLDAQFKGPAIFSLVKINTEDSVPKEAISEVCEKIKIDIQIND